MNPPAAPGLSDADLARRLKRMRRLPLLLLAAMAIVFSWTQWLAPSATWVGYVQAFAEAAMIGALADWFAVVALFRHPLGLPIPHTAIVPRRKDEIGESLGRFVVANFLTPDAVGQQMAQRSSAATLCRWSVLHADTLADTLLKLLGWTTEVFQESRYREFFARNVLSRLEQLPTAGAAGRLLGLMASNSHHQALLTELLRVLTAFLEDHRESLRGQMQSESPWWVPEFVDQKIYDKIIDRVQQRLLEMVLTPDHEIRQRFDSAYRELADSLMDPDSLTARRFESVKAEFLRDPNVRGYSEELWRELSIMVGDALKENRGASHSFAADLIRRTAMDALDNPSLIETFDRWLHDGARFVVAQLGEEAAGLISSTVRSWDPVDTAKRIELQIGPDLQFIRINGTLVGGLVGLLLHTIVHALP
ncbi:MAG: DUF445 domain-containing protein [Pseudomonadota bacterium]